MILAFTGTQIGMTTAQTHACLRWLAQHRPSLVLHGDCVGADEGFDICAHALGLARVIYPSDIERMRVHSERSWRGPGGIIVNPPAPPLERNAAMVRAADRLLACPKTHEGQRRSGTWSTVRYAVRRGKPVTIIRPDGTIGEA